MPQCIFCEWNDLPVDTEECPDCGKKPFSGMYFDKETYNTVASLEETGKIGQAWDLLMEQWYAHADRDYFDDDMYHELGQKMHELFSRYPILIDKRIELFLQQMACEAYYGGSVGQRTLDEGKKICKQAKRPDLELMVVEECWEINSRGQYPRPEQPDELVDYVKELEELIEKMNVKVEPSD
jgi:hypothetical protein